MLKVCNLPIKDDTTRVLLAADLNTKLHLPFCPMSRYRDVKVSIRPQNSRSHHAVDPKNREIKIGA